jgi:GH24 family phage-related lysozyme (muramidase)
MFGIGALSALLILLGFVMPKIPVSDYEARNKKLQQMTKDFEGFREDVYPDPIHGWKVPTVGYGFNVNAGGVPKDVAAGKRKMGREEAEVIFQKKYKEAEDRAVRFAGENKYSGLNPQQQAILNDMSYNLGEKLFKFKEMRKAIQSWQLENVPREMKDSSWYKQVGNRSKKLIELWNKPDV